MSPVDLSKVERGNTSPGVNRAIIKYLLSLKKDFNGDSFLDVPCGAGSFLNAVKSFFPNAKTTGGDINTPPADFSHEFQQIDAQTENTLETARKYKIITCISGVMEFDNTLAFFDKLKRNLDENGLFIVTNDNLMSVRDRILYLLFGRFRQYKLLILHDRPTWKILTLQNLLRILTEAGFEATEIEYVEPKNAELVWLPIALPIYLFQYLYLRFSEPEIPFDEKKKLYPFSSLLARHYIVVCRLKR